MAGTEPMLSSYLHAQGAKLGLPISGTFELTARCNFSCPMCYVHLCHARAEDEMSASQWLDIAEQAKNQGMMFALLTGGEPFIRKDFFEIYEGMKAMGLMISINSNGSMLSGIILKKLLENPPFRINISLYGGCEETYRQMCGRDAFHQVLDNITALKAAGVDVRLNYSITPFNCQDMAQIHRIAQQLDVHVKASSYMYPPIRVEQAPAGSRLTAEESALCGVQWEKLRLSDEEFAKRAKAYSVCTEKECTIVPDEGVGCRAGTTSFWMTWDGRMLPCGMMPGPTAYPLQSGFKAAWEQIRAATQQIRLPSLCANCSKRQICNMCASVCVTETGAFDLVPEYVCRRADETIRLMQQYAVEDT